MNIEEILNRLERIDHKEYRCGFEFADSSTFDEMGRCFEERKILAKEIERLNKEIERLRTALNSKESIIKEVRELLNQDKASASFNTAERNALEILDKVDKENI